MTENSPSGGIQITDYLSVESIFLVGWNKLSCIVLLNTNLIVYVVRSLLMQGCAIAHVYKGQAQGPHSQYSLRKIFVMNNLILQNRISVREPH